MGYVIKAPLGLGLFVGGLIVANIKLVSLLETGTCASGNTPYQIAQPCPSGTGTDVLLLMGSIFATLIGIGLFTYRGNPPWDKDRPINLDSDFSFPAFGWGVAFTATGAVSLSAALTNEAVKQNAGSKLGALIVGGVFLVMGLPVLFVSLRYLVHDLTHRDEQRAKAEARVAATSAVGGAASRMGSAFGHTGSLQQMARRLPWGTGTGSSAGSGGGTGDQIAKLERLQRLRQSGALTDAEFEREKARVLSES
jgi:putative oligomerization/nucleic acid binding protein